LPPRCERTTVTLAFHLPSLRYRQSFPDETAPLPSDTHMSFRFILLLRGGAGRGSCTWDVLHRLTPPCLLWK
jgi:hypothetical protein